MAHTQVYLKENPALFLCLCPGALYKPTGNRQVQHPDSEQLQRLAKTDFKYELYIYIYLHVHLVISYKFEIIHFNFICILVGLEELK